MSSGAKMITLRMSVDQKEKLDSAAHASERSCNQHCLVLLGLITEEELMEVKAKETKTTVVITVRMSADQKARLDKVVKASGMSMNKYCVQKLNLKDEEQENHAGEPQ
jgi:uncharacterized protein (DUF1778 family)